MTIFAASFRLTSPERYHNNMKERDYNAVKANLKRQIKAIFGDNLVSVPIDSYDDAMVTECLITPFECVKVVICGNVTRQQLLELVWYGINLVTIMPYYSVYSGRRYISLLCDCREFATSYQSTINK